MPKITMSVHGNAFYSEQRFLDQTLTLNGDRVFHPSALNTGTPFGWGRSFAPVTGWYHVALPNIIAFDNRSMYVDEIFISLDRINMRFDRIDLWVGRSFAWSGPPRLEDRNRLFFYPRSSGELRLFAGAGLGVSLHFTRAATRPTALLTFHSATLSLEDTSV